MKEILTPSSQTIMSGRALIFNADGLIPIVQRLPTASNNPGKWELVGGTINEVDIAGGIEREVLEEIGVDINLVSPIYGIQERPLDRGLNGKYLAVCALAETVKAYPKITLQTTEAAAYDWATMPEILNREDITTTSRLAVLKLGEYATDVYFPDRLGINDLTTEYMSDLPHHSQTDN